MTNCLQFLGQQGSFRRAAGSLKGELCYNCTWISTQNAISETPLASTLYLKVVVEDHGLVCV
jgi:hypothetical protein